MSAEWIEASIGEFINFRNGKTSPDRLDVGEVAVFGSNGIIGYSDKSNAEGKTLIIGRVGSYCGSVYHSQDKCWVTDNAIIGTAINNEESEFWYFLLRKLELNSFRAGSGQPFLNQGILNSIRAQIPNCSAIRKQIGKHLMVFNDKIELNRQINQTLEQIAHAIFKSWFVDFEPVKAKVEANAAGRDPERAAMCAISGKPEPELNQLPPEQYQQSAATAALFPDELVESELGLIPKGWEVSDFGAVSTCYDKHRIPLSSREREKKKGLIPYYGATSVMDYVDEAIFDGVYLLLGEDGSVLREDGTPFVQYIWGKSWVNNHAHVLQGSNGVSTEQLMLFISMQNISAYVTGAVQLKLNQKNMNSIPFIKAPNEVNESFSALIAPLYAQHRSLVEGVRNLTEIRDTLLPKLLSGEIEII